MSDSKNSFQNPIAKLPKWAQWVVFVAVFIPVMIGFTYFKNQAKDSPEAKAAKTRMAPLAAALDKAQRLGDNALANAVLLKVSDDPLVPGKDEAIAEKVKNTPLRYCQLAAFHLFEGAQDVRLWGLKKDKYEASIAECQ